jgi:L-fuculose-phosphate aldolase
MNSIFSLRKEMVEICKLIYSRGLVVATDGNISARLGENEILITPSGKSKGMVETQDLVVIDLEGKKISGNMSPSGEFRLHTMVYKERPDINAVVHAHPPYSTAFSVAGISLIQCVLPEVVITIGGVPLTEYATLYTEELPLSIKKYIKDFNALLLKNHGVVTVGENLLSAYHRLEKVEHMAQIIYLAKNLGNVDVLSKEQLESLIKVKESLGLNSSLPMCETCDKNCVIKR